mmetsp:Transcript_13073/g.25349  ORF Transcript_13073/g.25349 Transcript_13073/m.25349 type:complete len:326 (-) Transcript_13073:709-1686(-)
MAPMRGSFQGDPSARPGRKWTISLGSADPPVAILIGYVHQLQVERGKSAMWIASATQAVGRQAVVVMKDVFEARNKTDANTAEYAKVWPSKEQPLRQELTVLRASTDHFRHPILTAGLEADARAFLSVLSGYTKLIELLCAAIDKQLRVGWHGAVLRCLIRFDEAMAHQRGLLCSLLVLPERLFSAMPPSVATELQDLSRVQTQTSSLLAAIVQARKMEPRCRRLVASAISLSRGLQSLQAQLTSLSELSILRGTTTAQQCWLLFSQHLEDNRVAGIALAVYIKESVRVRLPVFFHRVRGNTDINVKMTKRSRRHVSGLGADSTL